MKPLVHGHCRAPRPAPAGAVGGNSLFDSLPAPVLAALRPQAEMVNLVRGHRLMTLALDAPFVYFPVSCALTVDVARADGTVSHLRVVGSDGMTGGLGMLVGADLPELRVSVIRSGSSLRFPRAAFLRELQASVQLRTILHAYTRVLRGNVERWAALPRNAGLGAPLLAQLDAFLSRPN